MRLSAFLTRPQKRRKSIAADPQRHLLYSLERTICGAAIHTHCDREHLEAVIQHACRKHKVKPAKLVIFRSKERIFGRCIEDGVIRLNAQFHGDNLSTLLHELAHYIHWQSPTCESEEDHGPEFVFIYADLLDRYRLVPYDAFTMLLDDWGINY